MESSTKHFIEESELKCMAKQGMRRPDPKQPHGTESNHKMYLPNNEVTPVPEIQGKAKSGKKRASKG